MKVGNTEKSIIYESAATGYISGNPITYYNGSDYTFTWQKGRQLASTTTGGTTTSYTYDMSGVRNSKTVGSTLYRFDTLSGQVTHQEWGNQHLYFIYDDSSQPYALLCQNGSDAPSLYYYMLNLQGDVIGIPDSSAHMNGIEFLPERHLNRDLFNTLETNEYIRKGLNIMLIGATGCGKTYISCALATHACRYEYHVRYYRLSEFFSEMEAARIQGIYEKMINRFQKTPVMILDDFLLLPTKQVEQ